jgi:hypothetical protein
MNVSLMIASAWVIVCNGWHIALVALRSGSGRPLTISEHAVESKRLLLIHRVVHSLPVLLFLPLAAQLSAHGYSIAATLLLTAAVFDCVQVLGLNKKSARLENRLNAHSIAAWIMALSYLFYSAQISQIASVPPFIYGLILAICLLLLLGAATNTFKKYFLAMQMSFFILLSSVGLIAHTVLIVR